MKLSQVARSCTFQNQKEFSTATLENFCVKGQIISIFYFGVITVSRNYLSLFSLNTATESM